MSDSLKCVSPVDGSVYLERPLASGAEIQEALEAARRGQDAWRRVPIEERQVLLSKAVDAFVAKKPQIAEEIAWQMGRPAQQAQGEVGGFEERARYMIEAAPKALADVVPSPKEGFTRYIQREPLGTVFVLAPWNFPYLTSVNSVIPALMAGNAVILKHSAQTPLCAERYAEIFQEAGLPEGVFQYLHLSHGDTMKMIEGDGIDFVAFTGSVPAGHAVQEAAAKRFIGLGLELGGKDPAYVRADADLQHAIVNVMDGALFNAGQSCCGIERIYVAEEVYDDFVEGAVEEAKKLKLGNPLDKASSLGPMVRAQAAEFVRGQVADAVAAGARALVDPADFPAAQQGSAYMAPQVLVDVTHAMRVMTEESFGPIVGIMKVSSDVEAVTLMNDSDFGLTASVWTKDEEAAIELGNRVQTGTWFMNRCDYLDPALAWTGVKDSGRGCTLSSVGYEQLTRPKSFHLRTAV